MTWTRLSDVFPDSPAVLEISDAAFRVHIHALIYCNKHLTDGALPKRAIRLLAPPHSEIDGIVTELVDVGLWVITVTGGYQLDWSDQESAESVRQRQKQRAETQSRYRDRKQRHAEGDHSRCDQRYCKRAVTGNATAHVTNHETPSRPVPSRPDRREGAGAGDRGSPSGPLPLRSAPSGEPSGDESQSLTFTVDPPPRYRKRSS